MQKLLRIAMTLLLVPSLTFGDFHAAYPDVRHSTSLTFTSQALAAGGIWMLAATQPILAAHHRVQAEVVGATHHPIPGIYSLALLGINLVVGLVPWLTTLFPNDSFPEKPADRVDRVKSLLGQYFSKGPELQQALSLFGELLTFDPERIPFFQQMIELLQKERRNRGLSRRDCRLLLDWIGHSSNSGGPLRSIPEAKISYGNFPQSLAECIVKYRLPLRLFNLAYYIDGSASARPAAEREAYVADRLSPDILRTYGPRPVRERKLHKFLDYEEKDMAQLPAKPHDVFEVWVSKKPIEKDKNIFRIFLRPAEVDKAALFREAQGEFLEPTKSMFIVDLERRPHSIFVAQHQPVMSLDPQLDRDFPAIADLIRKASNEWITILEERLVEINGMVWPQEPSAIKYLEMPSSGYLLHLWPGMAGETAMRYYTDFPSKRSFHFIELGAEEAQSGASGFWIWRKEFPPVAPAAEEVWVALPKSNRKVPVYVPKSMMDFMRGMPFGVHVNMFGNQALEIARGEKGAIASTGRFTDSDLDVYVQSSDQTMTRYEVAQALKAWFKNQHQVDDLEDYQYKLFTSIPFALNAISIEFSSLGQGKVIISFGPNVDEQVYDDAMQGIVRLSETFKKDYTVLPPSSALRGILYLERHEMTLESATLEVVRDSLMEDKINRYGWERDRASLFKFVMHSKDLGHAIATLFDLGVFQGRLVRDIVDVLLEVGLFDKVLSLPLTPEIARQRLLEARAA